MEFRSYRLRIYPNLRQRAQLKRWMKALRNCISEENIPAYLPKEAVSYHLRRHRPQETSYISEIYLECKGIAYPYLYIRGLGPVRCAHRKLPTPLPKHVRLFERRNGDVVALFTPAVSNDEQRLSTRRQQQASALGIDLGVSTTVSCSNGEEIHLPQSILRSRQLLRKRQLLAESLQATGHGQSCKARKLAQQIERTKRKLKNQERDFLQQAAAKILKHHEVVIMETLDYDGIIKRSAPSSRSNARLLPQLHRSLLQKALRATKVLLHVSRWFPSSQICSHCGFRFGKHPLSERRWECPHCHHLIDRDLNASQNILQEGLRQLQPT